MNSILLKIENIFNMETSGESWEKIISLSDTLVQYIVSHDLIECVDPVLYQYLEDYDVRIKDATYAIHQLGNVQAKLKINS